MEPQDLIEFWIESDTISKKAQRCIDIKKETQMMVTGHGQDSLLKGLRDENNDQEKIRLKLNEPITPIAIAPVKKVFKRAIRVDGVKENLDHESEVKLKTVRESLKNYHGRKGVDNYLDKRVLDLNFKDPNTFILSERIDVKGRESILSTSLYPVEVYSEQLVDFEYKNGNLQYLIFTIERIIHDGNLKPVELKDFYYYGIGFVLEYKEIIEEVTLEENMRRADLNRKSYVAILHENKSEEVPAMSVGVMQDPETEYEGVYVPLFWEAMPILRCLAKWQSYLMVGIDKVIIPWRGQYVPRCNYVSKEGPKCVDGWVEGEQCPSCKGKGYKMIKSEQDVFKMLMPEDSEGFFPDLSKLHHEADGPIQGIEFLHKIVEKAIKWTFMAIFNAENVEQQVVPGTATEVMVNSGEKNDVVYPFRVKLDELWAHIHRVAFQYHECSKGSVVERTSPTELNIDTEAELFAQLSAMLSTNTPYPIRWAKYCDYLQKIYRNDHEKIANIKAIEKFRPWRSQSSEQVGIILQQRAKEDPARILYENFDAVTDLVFEANPQFYKMEVKPQKNAVVKAIDTHKETIIYEKEFSPFSTEPVDATAA